MNRNRTIGRWGEQAAEKFLRDRDYEITARNVRTPYGEIDLVVLKDGQTVFVEVKARTGTSFGPPEVAVTRRKQAHMQACAEHYAQQHGIEHWQIDVIAVQRAGGRTEITHFESVLS